MWAQSSFQKRSSSTGKPLGSMRSFDVLDQTGVAAGVYEGVFGRQAELPDVGLHDEVDPAGVAGQFAVALLVGPADGRDVGDEVWVPGG